MTGAWVYRHAEATPAIWQGSLLLCAVFPVDDRDGQRAEHAHHGQADDEEERAAIRPGGVIQRAGDGAAEAGEDQVAVDQREVHRIVGGAEIGAAEGGVGGRDAGIGQTAQHEARDDHRHAAAGHGQQQHHGGDDKQPVDQLHGQAAAVLVVHAAEQHTTQGVADGDQPHDGGHGRGGLVGTGLPHHAAGLRDQGKTGGADGDSPDVVEPEGGLFQHLHRLDVRRSGTDGGLAAFARRSRKVRAGRHKEEGAHRQHREAHDAHHHKAGAPAADAGGRPRLIELADEEAAAAEAHQQHAGDQAGLVREPLDHGAHDGVVAQAGAQAAQHAEAQIQCQRRLAAAGDVEPGQKQHRAQPHGVFGAEPTGQQAAQQGADAEQDHHQCERQAQLRLRPAGELRGDGGGQHAPCVHKSGEQQDDDADDGVDPAIQLLHGGVPPCFLSVTIQFIE